MRTVLSVSVRNSTQSIWRNEVIWSVLHRRLALLFLTADIAMHPQLFTCHVNSCHVMLFLGMPCHRRSDRSIARHSRLYHDTSCHIMALSYNVISNHDISCTVISCHAAAPHIRACHLTLCHVLSRFLMSQHDRSDHIMLCLVMPSRVTSCHVRPEYIMTQNATLCHDMSRLRMT